MLYPDRTSARRLPPPVFDMGGPSLQCFLGTEDDNLTWDTQFPDSFSYSGNINQPLFIDFHTSQIDYSLGLRPYPNKSIDATPESPASNSATFFEDWPKQDLESPSNVTTTPTNTPTLPRSITTLSLGYSEAIKAEDTSPTRDMLDQAFQSPTSISPRNLCPKRPCSLKDNIQTPTLKHPVARKRGRPRLNRAISASSADSSKPAEKPRKARIPHTEVERKYRRGLNAELERLRRVIPTLPQIHDGTALGQARLSKAMVLSAAIDYIKRTELERDAAMGELHRLRSE